MDHRIRSDVRPCFAVEQKKKSSGHNPNPNFISFPPPSILPQWTRAAALKATVFSSAIADGRSTPIPGSVVAPLGGAACSGLGPARCSVECGLCVASVSGARRWCTPASQRPSSDDSEGWRSHRRRGRPFHASSPMGDERRRGAVTLVQPRLLHRPRRKKATTRRISGKILIPKTSGHGAQFRI